MSANKPEQGDNQARGASSGEQSDEDDGIGPFDEQVIDPSDKRDRRYFSNMCVCVCGVY